MFVNDTKHIKKRIMMNSKLKVGLELGPWEYKATHVSVTPPITDTARE